MSLKFGDRLRMDGQIAVVDVATEWDNGDGMTIRVLSDRSPTTVYLGYTDPDVYALMKTEQAAAKQQNLHNTAKQRS